MGVLTKSVPIELTPNVINQPVFSTRKVTTSVSVYDGQTVVLGGLMREDVQKTEDKVPIIGDIPLVGRAFRTNTEQHTKKNLVIFVTAKIITPAGLPLNEEDKEGLLPPELPRFPPTRSKTRTTPAFVPQSRDYGVAGELARKASPAFG